jgi:ferredoxin-NADP reductase
VFIAGGIGITPIISILRHAATVRLPQRLILLSSNRRPEDAAYLAELKQLEIENRNFRLVAAMTEMDASHRAWTTHTGVIDEKLVSHAVADLFQPIHYVVGPPRMVEAMRELLVRTGVASDDIRSEEFSGY